MLSRLVIRNYTLIDTLDISFSHKLNILTGETGAGKSIILGALSLILGQRVESKYFFNQQKKCVIEGYFQIKEYHLADFFLDHDLDYEQETILRREILVDGKSRAFINDTPVTLQVLKQLGEQLIDIHSQHATLEINNGDFQLFVLDAVAGNQSALSLYQRTYKLYKQFVAQLKEIERTSSQAKIDQDYHQFMFDELDQANLKADEQEQLEQELDRLTHAEDIKRNLARAYYLLSDHEQATVIQLKEVSQNLQQAQRYQAEIGSLVDRLDSSLIEIKDIASEIDQIEQQTQTNEARSSEISARLNLLYSLQKKHQVNTISELLLVKDAIAQKLNAILFCDEEIERLRGEENRLHGQLISMATDLSDKRSQVIPQLELQIQQTLMEVGMPNAILQIKNEAQPKDQLNRMGLDLVQFLFSANKGQVPLPMSKVASGGELSRLMLSIKSLIARHTALPTIIFDEIDTGISGEVALRVGTIMEKLAENMQVMAITHLPQIASKGKAHYRVYKDEQHDLTRTSIERLDEQTRVTEIAQMLSGENPGAYALQNARELLSVET